jgi:kynurenine formamidase
MDKFERIDVSHTVEAGLSTYPGLPDDGFRLFAVPTTIKQSGSFSIRAIGLVGVSTRYGT